MQINREEQVTEAEFHSRPEGKLRYRFCSFPSILQILFFRIFPGEIETKRLLKTLDGFYYKFYMIYLPKIVVFFLDYAIVPSPSPGGNAPFCH